MSGSTDTQEKIIKHNTQSWLANTSGITVTALTMSWPVEMERCFPVWRHGSGVHNMIVKSWPDLTLETSYGYVVIEIATAKEKINEIRKFAHSFTLQVSRIPSVVAVFSRIERDGVHIHTVFNSDDEQIYDQIYENEQRSFAGSRDVKADFNCINLRKLEELSVRELIPGDAEVLFNRS